MLLPSGTPREETNSKDQYLRKDAGKRRARDRPTQTPRSSSILSLAALATIMLALPQVRGWVNPPAVRTSYHVHNERTSLGLTEDDALPNGNRRRSSSKNDKKKDMSRHRAISALSQPERKSKPKDNTSNRGKRKSNCDLGDASVVETPRPKGQRPRRSDRSNRKRPSRGKESKAATDKEPKETANPAPYSSLLPPPMTDLSTPSRNGEQDSLSSGLSSWEQFLGVGAAGNSGKTPNTSRGRRLPESSSRQTKEEPPGTERLPSIQDLFPPDLSPATTADMYEQPTTSTEPAVSNPLDGVLPVSDLFYRSSQVSQEDEAGDEDHDDEELPFSAEQSDALSIDHNKIRIRRNLAKQKQQKEIKVNKRRRKRRGKKGTKVTTPEVGPKAANRGRKMVRRGMEMLVGGVPINADPPQRSVQLIHEIQPMDAAGKYDWASTISLNTKEFGPLLHATSISKVSDFERGLFCEYFCHSTSKWDVCPKDLRQIVKTHKISKAAVDAEAPSTKVSEATSRVSEKTSALSIDGREQSTGLRLGDHSSHAEYEVVENDGLFETTGEFSFEIGVSREELESGRGGKGGGIFRSVFARAFMSVLERAVDSARKDEKEDFVVEIPKLGLTETDDGYTSVAVEFKVEAGLATSDSDLERRVKRISSVFTQAMDDGDIALAIAAAAKEEKRWPKAVRNRVVEECLFQDDDDDEPADTESTTDYKQRAEPPRTADATPRGMDDSRQSELYTGGGEDGVFYDFSEANAVNSPYNGEIGLRLVDAVTERAKQRHPRVIAIGDVHGCIDELQDLLRQCDYRPGDLVVFLGDLVCKGPDSISVVQMAREIGAIGVRGNHDFEVVRWHQAIKSGVDPPVFGSEHFHIASCLSKADMKWMYSLPWYISSKELSSLFVHAGFVSGIRLAKQNPRLMMNMRSILPDGTVTSKFFNNWPWARLWDGPQTVLFGHDADRGLQQYEHAIGLDTGCVYGGRLTACILPEKRLVSVSARREYFKYRRRHYD